MLNFVHAAKALKGEPTGKFTGVPGSDAYIYNAIEAIGLALAIDPEGDQEWAAAQDSLRKKLDEWIPVVLAAPMVYCDDERQRDTLNRVTFDPITTGALRLDVPLQSKWSAGILEWRVDGIYTITNTNRPTLHDPFLTQEARR